GLLGSWELLVGVRYLRSRRRSFLSLISALSLAGVTIGVATLLIVLAVMTGLESELRQKILGFNPHITVANYTGGLEDWRGVVAKVRPQPGVMGAAPGIYSPALLRIRRSLSGVVVRGNRPADAGSRHGIQRQPTTPRPGGPGP